LSTLGLVGLGTALDLRSRRIPNALTITGALVGLGLGTVQGGAAGAQQAVAGWTAGLLVLLAPCLLGWVGGGDLKLLAAVGSLQGPAMALQAGVYGMLFGAVLSVAWLLLSVRRRGSSACAARPVRALPYGPALAAGTVFTLLVL
jgi:prepilin peptidase CpaA